MTTVRMALAAALLFLVSGCGSSYSTPTTPTTPSSGGGNGTPVSIVRGAQNLTTTAYNPNPVTVGVGGSVTWTNSDTTTHTSTGSTWNSGGIAPGASYTMTFPSAGTFTYHCTLHPG